VSGTRASGQSCTSPRGRAGNTLPVVAGLVAAALYGVAAALWPPPQAAVPAVAAASESAAA